MKYDFHLCWADCIFESLTSLELCMVICCSWETTRVVWLFTICCISFLNWHYQTSRSLAAQRIDINHSSAFGTNRRLVLKMNFLTIVIGSKTITIWFVIHFAVFSTLTLMCMMAIVFQPHFQCWKQNFMFRNTSYLWSFLWVRFLFEPIVFWELWQIWIQTSCSDTTDGKFAYQVFESHIKYSTHSMFGA